MVGGMRSIWGEKRKAYSVQVSKTEERRTFPRHRLKQVDSNKMDFERQNEVAFTELI